MKSRLIFFLHSVLYGFYATPVFSSQYLYSFRYFTCMTIS